MKLYSSKDEAEQALKDLPAAAWKGEDCYFISLHVETPPDRVQALILLGAQKVPLELFLLKVPFFNKENNALHPLEMIQTVFK